MFSNNTLNAETMNIVKKMYMTMSANNIFSGLNLGVSIVASLYAMKTDADSKIVEILKDEIISLKDFISDSEIEVLQNNYKILVNHAFRQMFQHSVSSTGFINIPFELVQLCHSLSDKKDLSNIYLPFTGNGVFAEALSSNALSIKGFEEDVKLWALSQIRFQNVGINSGISLDRPTDISEKFDQIFSFPPLKSDIRETSRLLYSLVANNLNDGGEMFCILPSNFTTASGPWQNLRQLLVDCHKQYTTLLITLPEGLLDPVSGISLCFLYIKKDYKDSMVLVNANDDSFVSHLGLDNRGVSWLVSLKVNSLLDTISSEDERFVWAGSIDELSKAANMSPSRYLPVVLDEPLSEGEQLLPIGSFVKEVKLGTKNNLSETVPLVGPKELSSSYLNCNLKVEDIPLSNSMLNRVLTEDCLLACFMGGKMKIARLQGVSELNPIFLHKDVIPFTMRSKEDEITEEYLLRCLMSNYTCKQANAKAYGSVVKRITRDDFFLLEIIVPSSIQEQERICREDTRKFLTEADAKKIENYEEFRKDMHMKKHAIGQTLFNLNNWLKLLNKARENGNGIVDDNAEMGIVRKIKVADIYTNLANTVNKLNLQLSKFDTGYGLTTEEMPLTTFIEQYINEHQSPLFHFVYDASLHRADADLPNLDFEGQEHIGTCGGGFLLQKGVPLEYVTFSPEALTMVFNNIVSNACAHGFTNRSGEENLIKIDVLSEGTDIVVEVSNNGEPLKEDLHSEDVFTYGQTSGKATEHFGIGGYEVKKLMTEFDGSAELISTPNDFYTVTYRLVFHKTNIITSL